MRRKTKDEFVSEASKLHGYLYDYSKTEYFGAGISCVITCRIHGDFLKTPYAHLMGGGCKLCSRHAYSLRKRRSLDDFIGLANSIHHGKYDYSKLDYVNGETMATFICPTHGDFKQVPQAHLRGFGCARCGSERWVKENYGARSGLLYLVSIRQADETFLKIGITTGTIKQRFSQFKGVLIVPILVQYGRMSDLIEIEQAVLCNFSDHKYVPKSIPNGKTECFRSAALLDLCEYLTS